MSKDLRNMLDNIESSEKETAVLQSKDCHHPPLVGISYWME